MKNFLCFFLSLLRQFFICQMWHILTFVTNFFFPRALLQEIARAVHRTLHKNYGKRIKIYNDDAELLKLREDERKRELSWNKQMNEKKIHWTTEGGRKLLGCTSLTFCLSLLRHFNWRILTFSENWINLHQVLLFPPFHPVLLLRLEFSLKSINSLIRLQWKARHTRAKITKKKCWESANLNKLLQLKLMTITFNAITCNNCCSQELNQE